MLPEQYVENHRKSQGEQEEKTDGFEHRDSHSKKHCHVDADIVQSLNKQYQVHVAQEHSDCPYLPGYPRVSLKTWKAGRDVWQNKNYARYIKHPFHQVGQLLEIFHSLKDNLIQFFSQMKWRKYQYEERNNLIQCLLVREHVIVVGIIFIMFPL